MLAKFLGPHTVAPQSQLPAAFMYMPFGFSWDDVAAVTIRVSDQPVTIEGEMLTPAQKRELYEAGLRAQREQQEATPNATGGDEVP